MTFGQRLSDDSKLWVFPIKENMRRDEQRFIGEQVAKFLTTWKAHNEQLVAESVVLYDKFIVVAADTSVTLPSGCSIDALTRKIAEALKIVSKTLSDNSSVYYRRGIEAVEVSRAEFGELVKSKKIQPATIVFDNSVTTLRQFRAGLWELPFERSWHAQEFG